MYARCLHHPSMHASSHPLFVLLLIALCFEVIKPDPGLMLLLRRWGSTCSCH
jgi:hypothetical protein